LMYEQNRQKNVEQVEASMQAAKNQDDEMIGKFRAVGKRCLALSRSTKPHDYTVIPKCAFKKYLAILKEYHQPDIDIWNLKFSKTEVVFEKLQRQEISNSEAKAQLAEIDVEVNNMFAARTQAQSQREREFMEDLDATARNMNNRMPFSCNSSTVNGETFTSCY
jgi:hypothetical protein